MFAKSVLVTGCNRGIGLEFIKQLAGKTQYLFAACRTPEKAYDLHKLTDEHKNVTVLKLDVTQHKEIESAVATVSDLVGDNGLNCVINNAGMVVRDNHETVTAEALDQLYAVNTIGPAMVTKAFLPLIRQASSLTRGSKMSVSRASILNLSSKVGSIGDNSSGKNYSYRMSKAALNMLTVNLSVELKREKILTVCLHPGWVLTDMGGPNALIDTTKSVEGMLTMALGFTAKDNGSFYDWKGEKIPW